MQTCRTNFRMEDEYITIVRGDTLSFGVQIDGAELDSAYFTVKESYTDTTNVLQKSLGDGITMVEDGKYAVRVAPADTEDIEVRKYVYDLQIGVGDDIYTILRGVFDVLADVTRED